MDNSIKCPHCGKIIKLTEALTHNIEEKLTQSLKEEHEKEIDEIKKSTIETAKKELEDKFSTEVLDLKKQIEEREKKVAEFRDQELKLREQKRILEEKERELKLEVERRIDEERKKVETNILKQEDEKHRLRDMEKEKKIQDLQKLLEEAQRKAHQGSQQLQGEVLELDLEEQLKSAFPSDEIKPVEKGVKGADIRQIVKTKIGNICGIILWESKRTKAWTDEWLTKLKEDLRAEKANIPIIVSTILPKEAESGFGSKDGVWICSFALAVPIAEVLRQRMIDVAKERFLGQSKGEKKEELYQYITGHEFKQNVEALVEVYIDMHSQILKERAAFEKIWKAREAQVQKLFKSTGGMIGDMQGLLGTSSMPQIKGLELLELESGE